MIAYVETSALAKIALAEADSALLKQQLRAVSVRYCHVIGYIELRSAAARALRRSAEIDADAVIAAVENTWADTNELAIDAEQIKRAGSLCTHYALRAYDALHLAAAEKMLRELGSKNMLWFGFDAAQNAAAKAIGLRDGMAHRNSN